MISDFLVFEIRKNLNVLVTPKIFLKSRFHCIVFFIFKTMEYFSVSHQWLVRTYIVPYTAKDCFYPISSPLSCHNLACQKGMKQQEQRHSNMRLHPSNLRGGSYVHGLRTPVEKITFTARLKIQSQSQILRYGIFCLPHRPEFSNFFFYAFTGCP